MYQHLVFYDGECGLCDKVVQWIILHDLNRQFAFAPLQGIHAQKYLDKIPNEKRMDSVILIENIHFSHPSIYQRSQAIFRIYWLIGRGWKIPGSLFFLPSYPFDWIYGIIAKYRHILVSQTCLIPDPTNQDRFLS